MPSSSVPPLSIPVLKRQKEAGWRTLLANITSFLAIVGVAILLGGGILSLGKLVRGFVATVPNLPNPTSQLIFFYATFVFLVIFGLHFNETGRKAIEVVDHWIIRVLSIIVVGGSDLAGGRTWVAVLLYILVGLLTLGASVAYTFFIVEGTEIGAKTLTIFLGRPTDSLTVAEAILGSALITLGVLLSLLPTAMVLSRTWWRMVKRPAFFTIDRIPERLRPGSRTAEHQTMIVAHASDLHAFAPEQRKPDDRRLDIAIDSLANAKVQAILLTGDITEDGTHGAWKTLLDIPRLAELTDRLVIAPGNHDLNAVHLGVLESIYKVEHPRRAGTHIRALHYLNATRLLMGDRTRVLCPYTHLISTLSAVMERAKPDLLCWESGKKLRRKALAPAELLEKLFPMWVSVAGSNCAFMVWNSVKLNRWPLLNAIGEIDTAQLERADALLSHAQADTPVVHLIHHQVGVPRSKPLAHSSTLQRWQRGTAIGMGLQNPADLLDWLAARTQRTVILHGHHHKFFIIEDPDRMAHIVSSPSVTLGVETSYSRGVRPGTEGRWLELTLDLQGPDVTLEKIVVRSTQPSSAHEAGEA